MERRMERRMVTLGQLLDLIDATRDSDEVVIIKSGGVRLMEAPVRSPMWAPFESRYVNSIEARGLDVLYVWLEDEEAQEGAKDGIAEEAEKEV